MTRLISVAALVLSLLVVGACGDDDEVTSTSTDTSTASAADSPSGVVTPGPALGGTSTATEQPFSGRQDPVEKDPPDVPPVAIQTATRAAEHPDYDRVVFEFTENSPGYVIEYVEPPIIADPSGNEVEIEGEAFLQVRFLAAQAHDGAGQTTVDDLEIMPGLQSILEIERTSDFEGQLVWVVGLSKRFDFRVIDLQDPARVVVDVAHAAG